MKIKTLLLMQYTLISLSLPLAAGCCGTRPEKNRASFREMDDPSRDTLSDWSNVTAGLHASFVSLDGRYPKSRVPDIPQTNSIHLSGWKGEKVSAQLLIWTAEDLRRAKCKFGNFEAGDGRRLPPSSVRARFVRYVMTDEFAPGCGYRKPEDFAASLSADMLDDLEYFDLEAGTVRPVWLTFNIPADADAGNYRGKLKIRAGNRTSQELEIDLEVINRILPPPSEWQYHLDLWQHPSAVARIHGLELWSDAHFEKMRPLMKMLADAGQKVITATLNKDPWNNQCYDAYADMIVWTRNKDQSWSYDYTVFDKWVRFMTDLGIDRMINCYSLLTWNNQLHYNDEAQGRQITVEPEARSEEYKELWSHFLQDFTRHLRENGWLEKTNIAMDERSPDDMQAALSVLHDCAPELGISLADNHKSYRQYPWIKDICVGAGNQVTKEEIAARRERGLITTYYVCCSDKFPNTFTFSPPAEAVYAAWHAVACDFDGFLRWAYNSWVENPLTDSRFRTWPAGDTYIVYPEARSSIRFERLTEGIQDAEKIRLLRRKYTEENTPRSSAELHRLEEALRSFDTTDPPGDWTDRLNAAKKLLNMP
ncbi:MAG: DUF4091 domain-containing protein [Proteiniphilum sp.]|jgi:hypothetical protein|nr:DUF4091 domain-containing protein [Proteiniphilum sp.]